MKTKTIELYEFDELPEDVRAKVLERERDINVDYDWAKWSLEAWEEKLESMGFEDPEIAYSGFWSQRDGASFTCKSVNVKAFAKSQRTMGKFKNLIKAIESDSVDANFSVTRSDHHYCHEYTVKVESEVLYWSHKPEPKNYVAIEAEEGILNNLMLEVVRKLSKQIYRELEKEYEYLTSDEQVIDTIKANEYTFTASGEMENL